jgi:UTP--glucose-1-phosphate uridylyltransferase
MLFSRYMAEKVKGTRLDWEKIRSPKSDQILLYSQLEKCPLEQERKLLSKLAVLKLNGGLGTTMGCVGPKSIIGMLLYSGYKPFNY